MRKLILFMTLLLSVSGLMNAQQVRTVSGKVTDENGEALIGAGVLLQDGKRGTVTDIDGKYILELKADDNILTVSFIGYAQQEIVIGDRKVVDVQLKLVDILRPRTIERNGCFVRTDKTGDIIVYVVRTVFDIRGIFRPHTVARVVIFFHIFCHFIIRIAGNRFKLRAAQDIKN